MRIDPASYRRSMEGPAPRSTRLLTDLAEWRLASRAAAALRESCAGAPWFEAARTGLNHRGHVVLRVFILWTPSEPLPTVFPMRWDGVPVILRKPSGEDLDMRTVARRDLVAETSAAVCPGGTKEGREPEGSEASSGQVLQFRAPSADPKRGDW